MTTSVRSAALPPALHTVEGLDVGSPRLPKGMGFESLQVVGHVHVPPCVG